MRHACTNLGIGWASEEVCTDLGRPDLDPDIFRTAHISASYIAGVDSNSPIGVDGNRYGVGDKYPKVTSSLCQIQHMLFGLAAPAQVRIGLPCTLFVSSLV